MSNKSKKLRKEQKRLAKIAKMDPALRQRLLHSLITDQEHDDVANFKVYRSEDKAAWTKRQKMSGRITLRQIELLSKFGYGNEIVSWTKAKAYGVLEKEFAKRNQQAKA